MTAPSALAAAAPRRRGRGDWWRHRAHAARHRLGHSLKWRLVGLFLLLALATTVTFVAGIREVVSHAWRAYVRPLTTNYLDLLTAQIGTPPDIARAKVLTEQLPISIRIEGPRVAWDSHPELTDLNALIGETLAAHFAGRTVHTDVAPGLPLLQLNRRRMRLLLRNLLDNALRHSAGVAMPPALAVARQESGVLLALRDHGPGVPGEHLAQLAQAFSRADSTRQRATGGVGLGPYLCRLVAEAHGGTLLIRNAEPGLVVSVLLPVRG